MRINWVHIKGFRNFVDVIFVTLIVKMGPILLQLDLLLRCWKRKHRAFTLDD
jgi:hypothetical protein